MGLAALLISLSLSPLSSCLGLTTMFDATDIDPMATTLTAAPQSVTLSTTLCDITLKVADVHNTRVSAFQSWAVLSTIDKVADGWVIYLAGLVHAIKVAVLGEDDTIKGPEVSVYTMFDSSGRIKPEFATRFTSAREVEALFAEAHSYVMSIQQLQAERARCFPTARDAIQLAFDSSTNSKITVLKDAIAYRVRTGKPYKVTAAKVAARDQGHKDIPAQQAMSAAELLGAM